MLESTKKVILARILVTSFCVASAAGQAMAQAIECSAATPISHAGTVIYEIGPTWTGTRVFPGSAVTPRGDLVAAYFDEDRYFTLAALDMRAERVCRRRLPSRFAGWDAHNALMVAISPDGILHVTGNHHNSPLFYARGNADNLATITVFPMVGKDEDMVTYPTFIRDHNGQLMFLYRNGSSGAGTWYANRWSGREWVRVGAVFSDRDSAGRASAYPTALVTDDQGNTHVAIVWRRNPDLSSNYAISYVQTRDFHSWRGLSGGFKQTIVTSETGDLIDRPGVNSGLLNSAQLFLTPDGKPLVLYLRHGEYGTDSLYLAYANNDTWHVREFARSERQTPARGGGTVSGLPVFSAIQLGWLLQINLRFPPDEIRRLEFDLRNMTITEKSLPKRYSPGASVPLPDLPKGMSAPTHVSHPVLSSGFDGAVVGHLHWFAQTPYRDRELACTTVAPVACAPPPAVLRFARPKASGPR